MFRNLNTSFLIFGKFYLIIIVDYCYSILDSENEYKCDYDIWNILVESPVFLLQKFTTIFNPNETLSLIFLKHIIILIAINL